MAMADMLSFNEDGSYDLDLKGFQVNYCHVDMRFGLDMLRPLKIGPAQQSVSLTINSPFDAVIEGKSLHFEPGKDFSHLGPVLTLLWRTVESVHIAADGVLEAAFEGQATIRVPRDQHYEAWEFNERHGIMIVCTPDGELAIWGPTPPSKPEGMRKVIINPPALAKPVGFNHGIVTSGGRLLFLAGQDASDGDGHIVAPGDVVGQLHQVLRNLSAVVEAAGGTMENIVKLNIYVRDRDGYVSHLKALGRVFRNHFGHYYPTMALFEVSRLFQDDALIELEGIAVLT
jgi:enamine deaminase RidA (YjgF/YER057c/UK114 family)